MTNVFIVLGGEHWLDQGADWAFQQVPESFSYNGETE